MKKYTNWEVYYPERTEKNALSFDSGAMFLRDSNGTDWYELAEELKKLTGKYFVAVDSETNMVKCYSTEYWGFPLIGSTYCVVDSLPEGFSRSSDSHIHYRLKGTKFVPDNCKKIEFLKEYIDDEISWASSQVGALEDISLFGKPTKDEEARLLALRKYRFTLTRIKPEDNPDVDLPDRP